MGYHHTITIYYGVNDDPLASRLNDAIKEREIGLLGGVFVEPQGQSRHGYVCTAVFSHFDLNQFLPVLRPLLTRPDDCWVVYYSEHWGTDQPVMFSAKAVTEDEALDTVVQPRLVFSEREEFLLQRIRRFANPTFCRDLEEVRALAAATLTDYPNNIGKVQ